MRPKKIMIADDDAAIVDVMELILSFEGYEVKSTLKGETLLEMENDFPDLLLLDIWLSGWDGREICKKLKKKQASKETVIILTSASKDIELSALEAGADDFIAKPFDIDDLVGKVKKQLERE
jgi:DNA-binding response OmpR family regulator